MANKESNLAEYFPRDQLEDFSFSHTNIKKLLTSKYPVQEERVFKDKNQSANGLRIRVYPSSNATYFVEKRIRGASGGAKKRVIGKANEIDLFEARKTAYKFISWMAGGKDPYEELEKEKRENRVYTIRDAYNLYMDNRTIQKETRDRYERQKDVLSYIHIKRKQKWQDVESESQLVNTNTFKGKTDNLKSLLDADLNDITSQAVLCFHKSITNNHGHGNNKAFTEGDRVIQFLGSLYDTAIDIVNEKQDDEHYIKRNPIKIMYRARGRWNNPRGKAKRRHESLDTEHIAAHYQAIMQLKTLKNETRDDYPKMKYTNIPIPGAVRAHYFLRFMFWTGWRPGDVARIQWDQIETISDNDKTYTVVSWNDKEAAERLKNGEPIYRVPLNQQAELVIKELEEIKSDKLNKAKKGEIKIRHDYDHNHVFLNVLENDHIKPNQHHYEKKIQELANTRFYPTGIYRKTFLTYGNELKINIYTLKRLVFHTQNYFDVTSGYIKTHRQVLLDASEKIANYLNSYISPKLIQPEPSKQIIEISDVSIDKDIIDELTAQYGEDATRKTNDLIRIALALKTLNHSIYKKLELTTSEFAEFDDSDFAGD